MIRAGTRRVEGTAGYVSVTSGATHAKGAWVELISALDFDTTGLYINIPKGGISNALFDIGVGGAGAEKVVVPNVFSARSAVAFYVPLHLPAGARVSARCQANSAAAILGIQVKALTGGFLDWLRGGSRIVDYGTDLAATRGVLLQTGLANAKSAWVELTPATTARIRYLVIFHQQQDGHAAAFRVDIGVGAAGLEKVIIPDLVTQSFSGIPSLYCEPPVTALPCSIPPGVRLAVRYQCSDPFFSIADDFTVSVLGVG